MRPDVAFVLVGRRCAPFPALLAAYVECRLSPVSRAGVEAHLAECDICRSVLTRTATLEEALDNR